MEADMKDLTHENKGLMEARADLQIAERKIDEKNQEIDILKETVRSLYHEN